MGQPSPRTGTPIFLHRPGYIGSIASTLRAGERRGGRGGIVGSDLVFLHGISDGILHVRGRGILRLRYHFYLMNRLTETVRSALPLSAVISDAHTAQYHFEAVEAHIIEPGHRCKHRI